MYKSLRKILFIFPPEFIHHLTMGTLSLLIKFTPLKRFFRKKFSLNHPLLERDIFGLKFKNPLGLAAGFDKNAKWIDVFETMGFGFIEVGTITPRPQGGNPKPRLFRFPQINSILNRMGFNNDGVDKVVERLKRRPKGIIVGANIGKNKDMPNSHAWLDYVECINKLYNHVDYFTINISSPNTKDLRNLQMGEEFELLIHWIILTIELNIQVYGVERKPVFVKISPDLTTQEIDHIVDVCKKWEIDAIVATNTTINGIDGQGPGGWSGQILKEKSNVVIEHLRGKIPVIGVGGIDSPEEAKVKINLGSDLIQIYTGLIYQGPFLVKNILKELSQN